MRCSHQREGEGNIEAGKRRLKEEMGFTTDLKELFHFVYQAQLDNGLSEHELDHVLIGYYEESPKINKLEVADWKWMDIKQIKESIKVNPNMYTVWFKIVFNQFVSGAVSNMSIPIKKWDADGSLKNLLEFKKN